jgi:hypothetical protein
MWLIDGPLFPSKVSSKCPAIMFAVRRTASVPGRIRLRDFVFKIFSCDFRYTLEALLKFLRHTSEGCFFLSYGGVLPPSKIFAAHVVYSLYAKFSRVRQSCKELPSRYLKHFATNFCLSLV